MFTSILTILATLVGLWAWWVKRKKDPTPEERKADNREQIEDTFRNVYRLRSEGNHAEADAMLRRLASSSTVGNIVRDVAKSTFSLPDPERERLGDNSPKGEPGLHYPRNDDSTKGGSGE